MGHQDHHRGRHGATPNHLNEKIISITTDLVQANTPPSYIVLWQHHHFKTSSSHTLFHPENQVPNHNLDVR
jgi:hypothetical protein